MTNVNIEGILTRPNTQNNKTELSTMTISVNIGATLHFEHGDYAVIHVTPDFFYLCKKEVGELKISQVEADDLLLQISIGQVQCIQDERLIVDLRQLDEKYRPDFLQRKRVIRKITDAYGPDYMSLSSGKPKKLLDEIAAEEGVSRRTIRNWVLAYLQSGLSDASLLDKRCLNNSGRLSIVNKPESRNVPYSSIFDEAINLYKSGHGDYSQKTVYQIMLARYFYTTTYKKDVGFIVVPGPDKKPSWWQFYRYLRKTVSTEEHDKIIMGAMKHRNDMRTFSGSAETRNIFVYETAEMDAWEANFMLRDSRGRAVGSPVIYMIKDVMSRMIAAVSISFDNNSIVGCTNCLANLQEDKTALLQKYGIAYANPKSWLSGFKPCKLRVDNGADFLSDEFERMLVDLDIKEIIVPPAMGSEKGVVEHSFRDIKDSLKAFLSEIGYDDKKYGRDPKKEALLTIQQFTKLLYAYVIAYNESVNSGIALSPDMIEQKVPQIPARVMEYYLARCTPQNLPYGDDFLRVLLLNGTATINRSGLKFANLIYFDPKNEELAQQMYRHKKKAGHLNILYDPRNMDLIYYVAEGQLIRVPLNVNYKQQKQYQGMTYAQVNKLFGTASETKKNAEQAEFTQQIALMATASQVLNEAYEENPNYSDTRNVRKSREEEKQNWSAQNSLEEKIGNGKYVPDVDDDVIDVTPVSSEPEPALAAPSPEDFKGMDPNEILKMITGGLFDEN